MEGHYEAKFFGCRGQCVYRLGDNVNRRYKRNANVHYQSKKEV